MGEVEFLVGLAAFKATELPRFRERDEVMSLVTDAVDDEARCVVLGRLAGGGS
jgi:hypothetical protein